MRDQLVQVLIARKGAQARLAHQRAERRREIAARQAALLAELGIDPDHYLIGGPRIAEVLGRPPSTIRRWIARNLWGLGDAAVQCGNILAVRTDVVQAVRERLAEQRTPDRPEPPERVDPRPPMGSSPSIAMVAAVAAAIDRNIGPVTLHQVGVTYGGMFEPGEFSSAAARLVRSQVLVRSKVPSRTGIGRGLVYAYGPGPRFAQAQQRNPRVMAKLREHSRTHVRTVANTAQTRMEQGTAVQ